MSVPIEARVEDGVRLLVITAPRGATFYANAKGTATRRVGKQCQPFLPEQQKQAEGGVQLKLYDYPSSAVRELVVNALIHRDYQIEGSVDLEHSPEQLTVGSPGGLVFGVTPENILTRPSTPRNRHLLETVTTLQVAERTGQGIDRVYREMLRLGKPPTNFRDDGMRVDVEMSSPCPRVAVGLRGPFNEADHDVVGVTVEVAAGPVIPRGHPGAAVPRRDLHIPQRNVRHAFVTVPASRQAQTAVDQRWSRASGQPDAIWSWLAGRKRTVRGAIPAMLSSPH